MSKYTFTFKKDDIFVEFTTADKDVVERQFQIWVSDADEYARNAKQKPQKEKTINTILAEESEEEKPEEIKTPEVDPPVQSEVSIPQQPEPAQEINIDPQTEIKEEQSPIIDKASTLLKTINSIQNETLNPQNIEEKDEAPSKSESPDFESILEKTIENPVFEPDKTKDQIFLNLINSKNTKDKFHYLVITAYYLSEFEKMERFSLKQINAKLMQNMSEVIDHTMLQDAINQNLLEIVPDLTGVSEVGEYRLTQLGEEFFANRIG